jgi:hypothetical protein
MIEIIQADYALPEHGQAIVQLMDAYARDPMGGGNGLSGYAKASRNHIRYNRTNSN